MSFQRRASAVAEASMGTFETDSPSDPRSEGAQASDDEDAASNLENSDAADQSLCNAASTMPASDDSRGPSCDVVPVNVVDAWADVSFNPLQNARIATIPYTMHFATVFGLLQAAREQEEVSHRALALTSEATRLCAADYSSWGYRCFVVHGLLQATKAGPEGVAAREAILHAEDEFVRRTAERVPKSYQLWEYRRFLFQLKRKDVSISPDGGGGDSSCLRTLLMQERARVDSALDSDDKNYHAWSHLGWLAREALHPFADGASPAASPRLGSNRGIEDNPGAEWPTDADLIATGARIRKDVRNNSAYAHRWAAGRNTSRDMNELKWALDRTRLAPRNEAAWNYALALSRQVSDGVAELVTVAREHLADDEGNVPARRALVLAYGIGSCNIDERVSHCRLLATKIDIERYQYWMWKMASLETDPLLAN